MATKNSDAKQLSPMMEHYKTVKAQYPDTILMYRLGDFYEMFFEDAIEASKLLDLTLTGRDCGLAERAPMCGVPYHAVDGYVSRLVKCGKKVAICEQLTLPGDQKGMVKRDVIRVITAGTVTDDEMLEGTVNNYLLAVYANGKSVALCWADVSTGEVKALELEEDKTEDRILAIAPCEIIANAAAHKLLIGMESIALGKLPKPQSYYDYAFDTSNAAKEVLDFYKVNNLGALGLAETPQLVPALGGLLQYVESTQKRQLSHFQAPKIVRMNAQMFLDYSTKRNLELTETLADRSKTGSLLWVLDKTRTNMGARALRRAVLEPMQSLEAINARLDAVEELLKNLKMREEVCDLFSNVRDIERLCNKIAYNSINPRECQAIAYSLRQLPALKKAVSKSKSTKLAEIYAQIDPLDGVLQLLESALTEAPPTSLKDGGVIRAGYNEELDSLRTAQTSAKKWLAEYEAKEREATGIKQLKVGFNRVFGYYIEVSNSNLSAVPYRFERKQTLVGGERFITEELKQMEDVILGAEEKALVLEEKLYANIKAALAEVVPVLQANARALAELDVLYSLAAVAAANGYRRPLMNSKIKRIYIKEGRHPVVEALKKRNEFVPNDAVLDDDSKTLIITGPNMAGKSTYMRQVALIVLMAHMGSFVPASEAEICLVDRVFTRVGASDNLAFGQSTFMVEMSEMANILNNATSKSLLVLDEIGRGTSTLDGLSIAWAIVEHIALRLKAKTLFATHYHELSELETVIPDLKNYHVLIKDTGGGITFLYKIARGGANKSFGIEVASLAGVNCAVIERAKAIMATLEESKGEGIQAKISAAPSEQAVPTSQIGFFGGDEKYEEIASILNDIDVESITPLQALTLLANLQKMTKPPKKGKK